MKENAGSEYGCMNAGSAAGNLLFVCGTLLSGYHSKETAALKQGWALLGRGRISGRLYDLGSYPAASDGGPGDWIVGEVYDVKEAATVFPPLDEYEGAEYRRELIQVNLADGTQLNAWMYRYAGKIEGAPRIDGGDYIHYLKNKKDRFV